MSDKNLSHLSEEIRQIERQFKERVEPYRSDLLRYCYRLTGSAWDAEDLVQDTLLKSLSVLAKLYQPVNTKAYLFRIATNLWIDQQRKRNGRLAVSEFEHSVVDQSSEIDYLLIENVTLKSNFPVQRTCVPGRDWSPEAMKVREKENRQL